MVESLRLATPNEWPMGLRESYSSPFHDREQGFDAAGLVQQLTLFETVTVESGRYVGNVVDLFGLDGLVELLDEGCLRFSWESSLVGKEDHRTPGPRGRGQNLPRLAWFIEVWYVTADPAEKLAATVEEVAARHNMDAPTTTRLADAVVRRAPTINWEGARISDELTADLAARPELVRQVVLETCERLLERKLDLSRIRLELLRADDGSFRAETNFSEIAGVGPLAEHRLLGSGVARYIGTHKRLRVLSELESVGYFSPDDAAHMRTRSDILARTVTEDLRGPFIELIEAADVPTLEQSDQVDAGALLEMRETQEARAFRDWLRRANANDIAEATDALGSWQNQLRRVVKGSRARKLRWLATAGLGLAGPAVGVGGAAIDAFVLDKLLGTSGPVGFVDRHYKPLIQAGKRSRDHHS